MTEKMVKEGINDIEIKCHVVEKSITHHKGKNTIDAINEIDKPRASQSKEDKSIRNESNKGMSLEKSTSSQRTETEDKVLKTK